MRLTKLELHGFKSFFHQMSMSFSPGISAVVGPNGCGKSNIADAIRWVMGEQSATRLRGKSMEDIIFAGTANNRPMGYAEVSLSAARTNGAFPAPFNHYEEITVTRRLYRSGESEYMINKTPCRLKDIVSLFMDTGLGARGYAVIEQGSISRIIDSGPQERRAWIEEAAGIVKFKAQRNLAMRKMEQTGHNLERVADILAEVERQAKSLQRQAKKAERFNEYSSRVRVLDLALASLRYEDLTRELKRCQAEDLAVKDRRELLINKDAAVSLALEADRLRLTEQERDLSEKRETVVKLGSQVQQFQQNQQFLKEKNIGLDRRQEQDQARTLEEETRLRELDGELVKIGQLKDDLGQDVDRRKAERDEIQARLDEVWDQAESKTKAVSTLKDRLIGMASTRAKAQNAMDSATERLASLDIKRNDLTARSERAKQESTNLEAATHNAQSILNDLLADLSSLDDRRKDLNYGLEQAEEETLQTKTDLEATTSEVGRLQSRLSGLKALSETLEGVGQGIKSILTNKALTERLGSDSFPGLVVEGIGADQDMEAAVEIALAGSTQHLVARNPEAITAALDSLKDGNKGRAGLLSIDMLSQPTTSDPPPAPAQRLADLIAFSGESGQAAEALIGETLLVDDLETAFQVWEADGRRRTVVAKTGELISPPGVVTGGRKHNPEASLLSRQRNIREIEKRLAELDAVKASQSRALALAKEMLAQCQEQIHALIQEVKVKESDKVEQEKELSGLAIRFNELERRQKTLIEETQGLAADKKQLENVLHEQSIIFDGVEAEYDGLELSLASLQNEADFAGRQASELREELTGIKVALGRIISQNDQLEASANRIISDIERARERIRHLAEDISNADQEKENLYQDSIRIEEELKLLTRQVRENEQSITIDQDKLSVFHERLNETNESLKEIREAVRLVEQEARDAEVALNQTKFNLDHLIEDIQNRYQMELSTEFARHIDRELDQPAAREELELLQLKIQRMGPVNPQAVEEYNALVERKDFLEIQVEDLTSSMEDLKSAIRKINRTTLERFSDTFKTVAAKMESLGPILFGEGARTQMVLTEPDNPLDSGIDLKVQPPGKRLTSMGLLSGGEKALAAATLLFAIFLHKPSPFCLLDEVDAPLDEHNVERFSRLVKEIGTQSQILMITHNRQTMEMVDTLYGVTMPEPGVSRMVSVRLDSNTDEAPNGMV